MKKIEDYLHLYLGGSVLLESMMEKVVCRIINVSEGGCFLSGATKDGKLLNHYGGVSNGKLLLRPLSSMTEEEAIDLYCVSPYSKHRSMIKKVTFNKTDGTYQPNIITISWSGRQGNMTASYGSGSDVFYLNKLDPDQHLWMYKNRFDVHRLIEAGLAIDSTTLNPTT